MRLTKCKMHLECKLTQSEYLDRCKKMADAMNMLDREEDKLATSTSLIKASIKQYEGEVRKLRAVVQSASEMRDVDCKIEYCWDRKEKETIRLDTGEIVRVDTIDEHDLQEHSSVLAGENKEIGGIPENDGFASVSTEENPTSLS